MTINAAIISKQICLKGRSTAVGRNLRRITRTRNIPATHINNAAAAATMIRWIPRIGRHHFGAMVPASWTALYTQQEEGGPDVSIVPDWKAVDVSVGADAWSETTSWKDAAQFVGKTSTLGGSDECTPSGTPYQLG
jgi:hypothetical protein